MISAEVLSAQPAALVARSETVKVVSSTDLVLNTCAGLFSVEVEPSPKDHAIEPEAFTELLVKSAVNGVHAA